jgi:hypothetical protein
VYKSEYKPGQRCTSQSTSQGRGVQVRVQARAEVYKSECCTSQGMLLNTCNAT